VQDRRGTGDAYGNAWWQANPGLGPRASHRCVISMHNTGCITSLGLRNFKAFHYLDDLAIRPLTLLVGANSSGKSSILQSLLVLKQTLASAPGGPAVVGGLRFDGELTRLGGFGSVISGFDLSRRLEYRIGVRHRKMTVQLEETAGEASQVLRPESHITISFAVDPKTGMPVLNVLRVECHFPDLVPEAEVWGMELRHSLESDESGEVESGQLAGEWGRVNWAEVPPCVLQHATEPGSGRPVEMRTALTGSGFTSDTLTLQLDGSPIPVSVGLGGGSENEDGRPVGALLIEDAVSLLRGLLQHRLEYLGPVRADPRPFYPLGEIPGIGPRGETTIPYLLRNRSEKLRYIPAPGASPRDSTLNRAVNHWLKRMGVASGLVIKPLESVGYVAKLQSETTGGNLVNLANVGYGISQLLPVLTLGLKRPDDGLLLLEQPELHLHPKLQGDLAEFLLCVALAGKTVIVETHSDHLVNRLRRCVAEDGSGGLAEMVSIVFVHPGTPDDPGSFVDPLEIDDSGTIVNWPPDFLTDSTNEALAILRAARRRKKR